MATPFDGGAPTAADAASDLGARVTALFDDEAAWDADDTDAFLLGAVEELERAGAAVVRLVDGGGNSLLHAAALWNRPVIMEALVRRGAELNAANSSGHTPMDLAMHWGHTDLGQQLRHYGGKHSCEAERDLAVAQRDLARRQAQESDVELEHAASALRQARHEREALRVERDRVQAINAEILARCEALQTHVQHVETEIEQAAAARDALQVRAEHLEGQVESEKEARENAIACWKAAEAFSSDLQQQVVVCREREQVAVAAHNEALHERELAKELARQAHLDQGLATQSQRVAERERDKACSELLTAERKVATEKERCRKQLARVEVERRNIQIEIDRQTLLLRTENTKLEKSVRALTVAVTRQREELERAAMTLSEVKGEVQRVVGARDDLTATCATLQQRVDKLEAERRDAHCAFRERTETQLRRQYASDARNALGAVVSIWRTLQIYLQQLQSVVGTVEREPPSVEGSGEHQSPRLGLTRSSSSDQRPHTTATLAASASDSSGMVTPVSKLPVPASRPVVLPFLRDSSGCQDSQTTKVPSPPKSPGSGWTTDTLTAAGSPLEYPFLRAFGGEIEARLATLEPALRVEAAEMNETVANLLALSAFIDTFFTSMADWVVDSIRLFRKQLDAQTKMIERKDELIRRFTHHRQESGKKQAPARFRECSVRPML